MSIKESKGRECGGGETRTEEGGSIDTRSKRARADECGRLHSTPICFRNLILIYVGNATWIRHYLLLMTAWRRWVFFHPFKERPSPPSLSLYSKWDFRQKLSGSHSPNDIRAKAEGTLSSTHLSDPLGRSSFVVTIIIIIIVPDIVM